MKFTTPATSTGNPEYVGRIRRGEAPTIAFGLAGRGFLHYPHNKRILDNERSPELCAAEHARPKTDSIVRDSMPPPDASVRKLTAYEFPQDGHSNAPLVAGE
jgi:hypothetical protein